MPRRIALGILSEPMGAHEHIASRTQSFDAPFVSHCAAEVHVANPIQFQRLHDVTFRP